MSNMLVDFERKIVINGFAVRIELAKRILEEDLAFSDLYYPGVKDDLKNVINTLNNILEKLSNYIGW